MKCRSVAVSFVTSTFDDTAHFSTTTTTTLEHRYENFRRSHDENKRVSNEIRAQQIRDENEELRSTLENAFLQRLNMSESEIKRLKEETLRNAALESDLQTRLGRSRQVSSELQHEIERLSQNLSKEYQSKLEISSEEFEARMKNIKDQAESKTATLRRELILARADLKMTIQFLNSSASPFIKEEKEVASPSTTTSAVIATSEEASLE